MGYTDDLLNVCKENGPKISSTGVCLGSGQSIRKVGADGEFFMSQLPNILSVDRLPCHLGHWTSGIAYYLVSVVGRKGEGGYTELIFFISPRYLHSTLFNSD